MVEHVVCACVIVRALVGFWQESWESEGWRRGVSLIVLCSCACGGFGTAETRHSARDVRYNAGVASPYL